MDTAPLWRDAAARATAGAQRPRARPTTSVTLPGLRIVPSSQRRLLLLGLDAAEPTLIKRWMDEGALPNLARLRDNGTFGPLRSTAQWLVGSPWPTFYTSSPPEEHGFYHYLMWRPSRMDTERPSADRLPLVPFWRRIGHQDRRPIAVDMPIVYPPSAFPGIEISGWGTHEIIEGAGSHPPELIDELRALFGDPPVASEKSYFLSPEEVLATRDDCIRTTRMATEAAAHLMEHHPWDLFLLTFWATHRGGHQLWSSVNRVGAASPEVERQLDDALKQVYVECDTAVGRLVDLAGGDVETMVFSLHGMGPNTSRTDLLRPMLSRVLDDDLGSPPGLARGLRSLVPLRLRTQIKHRLPQAVQDRLTDFWRTGGMDWDRAKAFAVFGDLDGYIRVNLKGREARGIVEPGEAYEAVCEQVIEGLHTFVDADTGEPVVSAVGRREDLYPEGARSAHLPDLIVRWAASPAAQHRAVVSPRYGEIPWPTPGRHPQARSGNHLPDGFLIAAGGGLPKGMELGAAHIMDLAPTAYTLLGLDPPEEMRGSSLF
jgi:predicted AlkP superfamily phosphohydrolase/phosphomutase